MSSAQRRAQIVAAARPLFAERGFDATTTREIAVAAGISDALIYRHFANKDAILRTILNDGIARFSALGPPPGVDLGEVPLRDLLLGIGRAFLLVVDDQIDLIKLLVSQQHLTIDDTRFVEFVDTAATTLGAVIDARHPPEPGSGPGRGYLLARGYMGSLVALVLLQTTLGLDALRPVDPGAYLDAMVSTLVAGLEAETA